MPKRNLHGHVVAITGGARGIGRATAEALTRHGATVAIGDVDEALAVATARELGPQVHAYPVDVTDKASFGRFLDRVEEDHGRLDVLVNNAGIMLIGDFQEQDDVTIDLQLDVNVKGVLYGMKLAAPRMVARGDGHIVNLASVAGKGGYPGGVTYCATKHAVVGASEAMRGELRGTGVHVSTVSPSVVKTELGSGLGAPAVPPVEPDEVADAIVHTLRTRRNEVYVPRWLSGVHLATGILPSKVKAFVGRALGGERTLWGIDGAARKAYEDRAVGASRAVEDPSMSLDLLDEDEEQRVS